MTYALPFTENAVRRAIAGVRKAGLDVAAVSVAPDGTVTVHSTPPAATAKPKPDDAKWLDVEV